MTRIYDELVGVGEYCQAIDEDKNHSPFVGIAKVKAAERLLVISRSELLDLEGEGFFLVDPLGRLVASEGGNFAAFVFAPHVAQRRVGGKCPDESFDRDGRGVFCGFGGDRAKKLARSDAALAVTKAWRAWKHTAASSI
ncbi:MAG: hypothetical protein ABI577_09725 [bacterium]